MYDKFQKLLDEKGVTAYRVAQETGVSTATLTNWKKGEYKPKPDKLQKLANYFNVPISYFLEETKDTITITPKDDKDIASDLERIMAKLSSTEAPALFEGGVIPEEDQEMFAGQLEIMLKRLKLINKQKYSRKE